MQLNWSLKWDLSPENILRLTTKSAGVYSIWVLQTTGDYKCRYVGQASCLEERLLFHLSASENNKCIKEITSKYTCKYCTADVSGQKDRDGIERYLYDQFSPTCNEITPPSTTPIAVNLP